METLSIQPGDIRFDLAQKEPATILTLRNHSKQKKAFKVKTTMPKRYLVRPNQDIIEPGESMDVKISLQAKEALLIKQTFRDDPDSAAETRDKFLIQSIDLDDKFSKLIEKNSQEEESLQKPMSEILAPLWQNTAAQDLSSVRLKCSFDVPEDESLKDTEGIEDMTELRRKYNDLLMYTVQLTSERDRLKTSYEKTSKELNDLQKSSLPGFAQAKSLMQGRRGFALWQVILVALISFAIAYGAMLYQK